MSWIKDGYLILKSALSEDLVRVLAREFRMQKDTEFFLKKRDKRQKFAFSDAMVRNSYSYFAPIGLESLLDSVAKDIVEKGTRQKLLPTYSYGRIYFKGAEMAAHIDRPACEISATCCLFSEGAKWPLSLLDRNQKQINVHQKPGDILIYSGCELLHWRDKYQGSEHIQGFVHYVPDKAKNRRLKYDSRPALGLDEKFRA